MAVEPAGRFAAAIAAIDAANADDPHRIEVRGELRPKEQAHAELMSEWVRRLDPGADEAQLLAARAHHLRRWTVPRSSEPDGRAGYLRWRSARRRQHARDVAAILDDVGYDTATIERVQQIVRKEGLGTDPAVQTHEDALCLVFLETQLGETADRLGAEKMRSVAAKTMAKMSAAALRLVDDLPLRDSDRTLLAEAAGPPTG